jgi:type IV secretion system protein VirD4
MLLSALVSYIYDEAPDYEQSIATILLMLNYMSEDYEEGYKHAIDFLIEEKEVYDPKHLSVRQYNSFIDTMGEDAIHVIKSCAARLAPFNTDEMKDFMSADEFTLGYLGYRNTAVFIIPGNPGADCKLIAPLMYTQLFDVLCENNAPQY